MVTVRVPLQTTPERALAFADGMLATHGFRVTPSDTAVHAVGPSLNSTKENPLRGAGTVSLVVADGAVEASADLAGTRRLALFVLLFPPVLVSVQAVVFLATDTGPALVVFGMFAAMLLGWLAIGPLLAGGIRSRSEAAFRTFVANVAVAR